MIAIDLFCQVIDNFGDAGVCWRLARQLHRVHGARVRLITNDLKTLAHITSFEITQTQSVVQGIHVCGWDDTLLPDATTTLVIEGFGCTLPQAYLAACAARPHPPTWMNLEYLSAESWVADFHGLGGVLPQLGLTRWAFFPGFTARTGGLLREPEVIDEADRMRTDRAHQADFWQSLAVPEALTADTRLSLFAYEQPRLADWLSAWSVDERSTCLLVPPGRVVTSLAQALALPLSACQPGCRHHRGALTIVMLPWLSSAQYDQLLAACDLNFVRGEDSWVRAQWAGRPWIWHIYPQEEQAHLNKLEAHLQQVLTLGQLPSPWVESQRAWNDQACSLPSWRACRDALPAWSEACLRWRDYLRSLPELSEAVMRFHTNQVESRTSSTTSSESKP